MKIGFYEREVFDDTENALRSKGPRVECRLGGFFVMKFRWRGNYSRRRLRLRTKFLITPSRGLVG